MNIFLDKASLSPSSNLPQRLRTSLDDSENLILLANPDSAASPWVTQELEYWFSSGRGVDNVIVVKTGGDIIWQDEDFDWGATNAIPSALSGKYFEEPFWLDAESSKALDGTVGKHEFANLVARIGSELLDEPLDELMGEDVRNLQAVNRLKNGAIVGLTSLAITAIVLAVFSEINRRSARVAQSTALERALAITAANILEGEPDASNSQTAAAMAIHANRLNPSPQSWLAAVKALDRLPDVTIERSSPIIAALPHSRTNDFVIVSEDGQIELFSALGRSNWNHYLEKPITAAAWAPTGESILVLENNGELYSLSNSGTLEWRSQLPVATTAKSRHHDQHAFAFVDTINLLVAIRETLVLFNTVTYRTISKVLENDISQLRHCGEYLVISDSVGQVWKIDIYLEDDLELVHQHKGHVESLACSSNGTSIASSGVDDLVRWTHGTTTRENNHAGSSSVFLNLHGNLLAVLSSSQGGSSFQEQDGVNETWLFEFETKKPLWHHLNSYQSDQAAFIGDVLIAADEPRGLYWVDNAQAEDPQGVYLPHQLDFLELIEDNDKLLFVSSAGVVGLVTMNDGHRHEIAQLAGWPLELELTAEKAAGLFVTNKDSSGSEGYRRMASLVNFDRQVSQEFINGLIDFDVSKSGEVKFALSQKPGIHTAKFSPYRTELLWKTDKSIERFYQDESTGRILVVNESGLSLLDDRANPIRRLEEGRVKSDATPFIAQGQYLAIADAELRLLLMNVENWEEVSPQHWKATNSSIWKISDNAGFGAFFIGHPAEIILYSRDESKPLLSYRSNHNFTFEFGGKEQWFVGVDDENYLVWFDLAHKLTQRYPLKTIANRHENLTLAKSEQLLLIGEQGLAQIDLPINQRPFHESIYLEDQVVEDILAIGGSEKLLAVSTQDNSVFILKLDSGEEVLSSTFGQSIVVGSFSRDESKVAFGTEGGRIRVLDLKNRQVLIDLHTDLRIIDKIAFVHEDEWLLVSGQAGGLALPINPFPELCTRTIDNIDRDNWSMLGGSGDPPALCEQTH